MKKILTIISIMALLFSAGCTTNTDDGGGGSTSSNPFAVCGKEGLIAKFKKGSPPNEAYVGMDIPIRVDLVNEGIVTLSSGEVRGRLRGVAATNIYNPSDIESGNDDELLAAELDPSRSTIDLGTITFSPDEMIQAVTEPDIKVEVCFPYITKIITDNFWIGSGYKEKNIDQVKKGSISSCDNSAAPVQALDLEEKAIGDYVVFSFMVKNVGKGEVVENCFPQDESDAMVDVDIIYPDRVDCEELGGSSGTVKLSETGRKKITCKVLASSDEDAYKTPLEIHLDYYYDLKLETSVLIENL